MKPKSGPTLWTETLMGPIDSPVDKEKKYHKGRDFKFWVKAFVQNGVKLFQWTVGLLTSYSTLSKCNSYLHVTSNIKVNKSLACQSYLRNTFCSFSFNFRFIFSFCCRQNRPFLLWLQLLQIYIIAFPALFFHHNFLSHSIFRFSDHFSEFCNFSNIYCLSFKGVPHFKNFSEKKVFTNLQD